MAWTCLQDLVMQVSANSCRVGPTMELTYNKLVATKLKLCLVLQSLSSSLCWHARAVKDAILSD